MKKPVILVVDNEDHNRSTTVSILKNANYEVRDAEDGYGALESLQKEAPDMVLLELQLPDLDGVEICHRLKAEEAFRTIPVIFMTGVADDESKMRVFAAGGADYVAKPFIAGELLARVNAHLELGFLQRRLGEEIERYRALESAVFYGVIIHENGIIREVSDTQAAMVGYTPEEIVDRHIFDFIAPEDHARVRVALANADGVTRNIIEGLKRDGNRFPIEVRGKTIQYRGREARVNVIRDLSPWKRLEDENVALRAGLDDRDHLGGLMGKGLAMRQAYNRIIQAAASDDIAVIYGETGTGKELAARTIFELSPRSKGPFATVNCGAVQETIFESLFFGHKKGAFTGAETDTPGFFDRAGGGVLFLDEVGELTLSMQAKLLRVLEDGEYTPVGARNARSADVRIISATNRELRELLKNGQMREDFFQRIHVIPIEMPPLRNHKEDIELLANHFLRQRTGQEADCPQLPDRLLDRFMIYNWPGNVRELFNELRRYQTTGEISLDGMCSGETVPPEITEGRTYKQLMEDFERKVLAEALSGHGGNRSRVSEAFGIPRKTLQRKIKKYNL